MPLVQRKRIADGDSSIADGQLAKGSLKGRISALGALQSITIFAWSVDPLIRRSARFGLMRLLPSL